MALAIFVPASKNMKIVANRSRGQVATTYASIEASCPSSCGLRGNGCYGQQGHVGMVNARLSRGVTAPDSLRAALDESSAIRAGIASFRGGVVPQDGAKGGRDLRLHTLGDCATIEAAEILGAACREWMEAGGSKPWTYTHAWRDVPRVAWGEHVSVFASVDKAEDAREARALGYAIAYVTDKFQDTRAYHDLAFAYRSIPCPAQTREDIGCADCRLCMDDQGMAARQHAVVFEAHGRQAKKVANNIVQIRRKAA